MVPGVSEVRYSELAEEILVFRSENDAAFWSQGFQNLSNKNIWLLTFKETQPWEQNPF